MKVNGESVSLPDPAQRLLDFLRDSLELTGAKEGCGMGECGACTVLVDGQAICSCLILVGQITDAEVVTAEGLGGTDHLHPIQQAIIDCHASQCGFCTPGIVLSAAALLAHHPQPDETEVREALVGNLCRCTGYQSIFRAIASVGE